jgi:acetolactate synthase I/II/III large subunit
MATAVPTREEEKLMALSVEARRSQAEFGSDYVVEMMRALGIEYAAFNPGATFRGIHDSLVNFGDYSSPQVIEVCHEEISVAIAHGYAKATGRPMAAVIHNMVGLQHASMAIYNAWVDRVPIYLMGGTGPMDSTRRRPWIDWIHTANTQGNLIRDYVKFDDQPASLAAIGESMMRAYRSMIAEPQAPVYVNFDAEIQEQRIDREIDVPGVSKYVMTSRLQADPAALAQVADWLVAAQSPVILTSTLGRNPSAVPALVRLAQLLGAGVVSTDERMNIPTTHPLNVSGADVLSTADLILGLDALDLQGALGKTDRSTRQIVSATRPDARVIQIGLGDLAVRSWSYDHLALYPTDLSILADTSLAVPALADLVAARLGDSPNSRREARRRELTDIHNKLREGWAEQARREADARPVSLATMSSIIWDEVKNSDPVLAFTGFNDWPLRLWDLTEPYQHFGPSGGAGVGYGIGGAIGVALANKDSNRLSISLQPDGDLLYATSALWTAAHDRLPLLMVMHNNRSYFNSEEHARRMAESRGRPMERSGIGVQIADPNVDFASIAKGFGIWYLVGRPGRGP